VSNKNADCDFLVKLFEKVAFNEKDVSGPAKSPTGRSKSNEPNKPSKYDMPKDGDEEVTLVDLNNLIPDKFNEIPYVTQINTKRKGMETLNVELEKLVQR